MVRRRSRSWSQACDCRSACPANVSIFNAVLTRAAMLAAASASATGIQYADPLPASSAGRPATDSNRVAELAQLGLDRLGRGLQIVDQLVHDVGDCGRAPAPRGRSGARRARPRPGTPPGWPARTAVSPPPHEARRLSSTGSSSSPRPRIITGAPRRQNGTSEPSSAAAAITVCRRGRSEPGSTRSTAAASAEPPPRPAPDGIALVRAMETPAPSGSTARAARTARLVVVRAGRQARHRSP